MAQYPTREAQLVDEAQMAVSATRTQLRYRRAPVPQHSFRPSSGTSAPTVEWVFGLTRQSVPFNSRSWISGAPNEIVRAQMTDDRYSGGIRNGFAPGWV